MSTFNLAQLYTTQKNSCCFSLLLDGSLLSLQREKRSISSFPPVCRHEIPIPGIHDDDSKVPT